MSTSAHGALQKATAGDSAASKAHSQQMQSSQNQDYTFKKGDFQMMVVPAMSLEWNDNVNTSPVQNALDDFILTPSIDINAYLSFHPAQHFLKFRFYHRLVRYLNILVQFV